MSYTLSDNEIAFISITYHNQDYDIAYRYIAEHLATAVTSGDVDVTI